jgi:hypothetical protein
LVLRTLVADNAAASLAIEIYEVPLPLPRPEFALYWSAGFAGVPVDLADQHAAARIYLCSRMKN